MSKATFVPIRSAHIEQILSKHKDPEGKPMYTGLRYLFAWTVDGKVIFDCVDEQGRKTGRSMCVLVAGCNSVSECGAFDGEKKAIAFPYPPEITSLGSGWWTVSVYTDDSVPDELFERRMHSAIEALRQKADVYMATSGLDTDWRAEQDGVVWRVALPSDLDKLAAVHRDAHPHVNGAQHPHPLKPPVIVTLVAEKDGQIIGGMYVEAVAEVTMIGTSADAFATLPVLEKDMRRMLAHRAFRFVQTRVIPEGREPMRPTHEKLGFAPDTSVVLRQRV